MQSRGGDGPTTPAIAPSEVDWSGAWVSLLDEVDGARVLLVTGAAGAAAEDLRRRAAVVDIHVVETGSSTVAVDGLAATGRRWDVIAVDGVDAGDWSTLADMLDGNGVLAVVADHRWSPLRAADRWTGRPVGALVTSSSRLRRDLGRAGLRPVREYGLLRSSRAPVTAVDVDAPEAGGFVLQASVVEVDGLRRLGLRFLDRAIRVGRGRWLVPASLLVAGLDGPGLDGPGLDGRSERDGSGSQHPMRVTGRIGYLNKIESIVVRGEPAAAIDKGYESEAAADAEAGALEALAGWDLAPALLARVDARTVRQAVLPGESCNPWSLTREDVLSRAERAARVLGDLQRRTLAEGTVLVHGDYWLGNLRFAGPEVTGVIDWSGSRRGGPQEDLVHLVHTLVDAGQFAPHETDKLVGHLGQIVRDSSRHARAGPAGASEPTTAPATQPPPLTIAVVPDAGLDTLAPEWQALADESDVPGCCHPWWALPWYRSQDRGRPVAVTARDRSGELVGVLALHERRLGPFRVRRLVGQGLGSVGVVVHRPGSGAPEAIWQWLLEDRWSVLDLRNMVEGFAIDGVPALASHRLRSARVAVEPADGCPVIEVPDALEPFLMTRSKRLRKNIRRGRRRLDGADAVYRMDVVEDRAGLDASMADILTVYDASERSRPRQHLLRGPWAPFFMRLLHDAADDGRLRIFLARVDGVPVSFDVGLLSGDRLELTFGRFHPDHAELSAGHLALASVLEHARSVGTRSVDLGLGDDAYKALWTDDGYRTVDILAASSAPARRLVAVALEAIERVRRVQRRRSTR